MKPAPDPRSPDPAVLAPPAQPAPWWREPMVWLVLAGPAAVVVAGIATAVLAVQGADPVVAPVPMARADGRLTDQPAHQARNHAATGAR